MCALKSVCSNTFKFIINTVKSTFKKNIVFPMCLGFWLVLFCEVFHAVNLIYSFVRRDSLDQVVFFATFTLLPFLYSSGKQ